MTSRLLVDKIEGKSTSGTIEMPEGHIVQTVSFDRVGSNSSLSPLVTLTSSSFVDVMSKSITTKLASSKIFVSLDIVAYDGSNNMRVKTKFFRNSTEINGDIYAFYGANATMHNYVFSMLDSPSASAGTTLTYKLQGAVTGGSTTTIGYANSGGGSNANITLMEIAQ
jgi:hypothetical protein